jgi:peptidoglycan/LPS O-acetylase OafA/YrhL
MKKNDLVRLDILDISRFFAAISVVLYHYMYRGWRSENLSDLNFLNYDGFLKYGYLGVQFFFMVSGFVVYMSAENRKPSEFVASRIARLYPSYWVAIIITALFIYTLDDGRFHISIVHALANLTMISKLAGIPFVDGVYWTLIYELVFYFWIFIMLSAKIIKPERLLLSLVIVSITGQLLAFKSSISIIWCGAFIGYFAAGVCFYKIHKKQAAPGTYLLLAASFIACIMQSYCQAKIKGDNDLVDLSYEVVVLIIIAFYMFLYAVAQRRLDSFTWRHSATLGLLTYPCYLLHQNIGYIIFNRYGTEENQWHLLMATTIGVLMASYFIAKKVERPLSVVIRNFVKKVTA